MKHPRLFVLYRLLRTAFGLSVCALGTYCIIQANVGLSPWEALSMGVANLCSMSFGMAHMLVGLVILAVDLAMRERVSWGTLMDALLVGTLTDGLTALHLLPVMEGLVPGTALLVLGMLILALGQYFYMSAGQGCGPRDAFVVGVGRRFSRLPIGLVNSALLCMALAVGWVLGAPIGVGTLVSTLGMGLTMQAVFRPLGFDPRRVRQYGPLETLHLLLRPSGAAGVPSHQ